MLREDIQNALIDAMKSKDTSVVGAVRFIVAGIKNQDVVARGKGEKEASEAEIVSLMQTMIKQRKESAKIYQDANRSELADKELLEISVIEKFMPKQLSDAEIEVAIKEIVALVGATSIKDMGAIMAQLKTKFAGKMDFSTASAKIKAILS